MKTIAAIIRWFSKRIQTDEKERSEKGLFFVLVELIDLSDTDGSIGARRKQMPLTGQTQMIHAGVVRRKKSSSRMFTVETMNEFAAVQTPNLVEKLARRGKSRTEDFTLIFPSAEPVT